MFGQRKVAMLVAEFVGTFVLASAMMAMLVRTDFAFFSAIAAAVVYGLMYLVLGGASGSHLNPAVTIGYWTVRKIPTVQAIVYLAVQLLAGVVAWKFGQYVLHQTLNNIASGGWNWRVVVAEGVGTLVFGFGLAAVALNRIDESRHAVLVGAALFIGVVVASLGANGILNPAVAITVRSWSWSYVTAEVVGLVVGMNLYALFFSPDLLKLGSKSKSKKK